MTDSPLLSYSYNISILACKVTGSGGYKAWITTLENFKGWSRSGLHYFISPFTGQIPMKNPNLRIMEKGREFQKNIYFCFIDYAKAFDCVDHNKLENSERDGNTRPPDLPLEKPIYRSGSNS